MKSVIMLLALVAFAQAAPVDVKESSSGELSRPSPISPDVLVDPKPTAKVVLLKDAPVVNRQKRNEHKKPDSVKAHEQLHHSQPTVPSHHEQKPSHEGPHEHKHKREAHHEEGHHGDDAVPQKDEVKQAPEAHEAKKEKREAHHEEGHKDEAAEDRPQVEDLSLPHALPTGAHTAELPKKQEKRETMEKPDSVKARESLDYNPHRYEEVHKAIESLAKEKALEPRHKRDIPVPTQTKAPATELPATTKSELGSTTPSIHSLHIPHPIPVAELFEKNKHADKSTSSSEESKEKAKA